LGRAAADHIGQFGSARVAHRQFAAAASVDGCRDQTRQRRGSDLVADDICDGRDGSIKDPFQEINDEQLLALAGGRPVALVRLGPHQPELLFLNPEHTNGFPVH